MIPSGRHQGPVDFFSDVGLCVVAKRTAFTVLGALLIAGSAVQMAQLQSITRALVEVMTGWIIADPIVSFE
jgi:hypothetical protein